MLSSAHCNTACYLYVGVWSIILNPRWVDEKPRHVVCTLVDGSILWDTRWVDEMPHHVVCTLVDGSNLWNARWVDEMPR